MVVMNEGQAPTFEKGEASTIIDITVVNDNMARKVTS